MAKFGGETFVIGEASEKVSALNGVRVQVADEAKTGTIYNVYINREREIAQIWVNMDSGGARCFRPHHLRRIDGHAIAFSGNIGNEVEIVEREDI